LKTVDAPRTTIALDIENSATKKSNYLHLFESEILFHTFAVFVHKNGEREPLAGSTWHLRRELKVHWRNAAPQRETLPGDWMTESSSASRYVSELTMKTPEFMFESSDDPYKLMVAPTGTPVSTLVMNPPFLKSSPDFSYSESQHYPKDFDPYFWMDVAAR